MTQQNDANPEETREWLDALQSVVDEEGIDRAHFLIDKLNDTAIRMGRYVPITSVVTPYSNTIAPIDEERMPGDMFMERQIRGIVRWNALAMVMRANQRDGSIGGHISTFASAATLYDVGFNYFFKGPNEKNEGDLIYYQGHSSPGIYARSFVEGRLEELQLDNFRNEVEGNGLSSYPHPWLMPDYWQFPTVSMGLGPIQAIYQAHLMKYLTNRGLLDNSDRKIWAFLGDGEMDEPESLGAIGKAGRERLDNLIFVINCNLQRLDGPVRGNGKIIQELEGIFRGAGWNVIKVVWGRHWDPLLQADKAGILQARMDEVVDGEYQNYASRGGAYTREHFFGTDPELLKMVEHLSDEDIMALNRGGHDPYKVYAAYAEAVRANGKPTVILAKTVKGYAFGGGAEAQNATHSVKKLDIEALKKFRDRFGIPIDDAKLSEVPYYRPAEDSLELRYMRKMREKLGGSLPQRRAVGQSLKVPSLEIFDAQLKGSGEREQSTTMAFVRMLNALCKDQEIGEKVVPIVPDEARTFGMEGMFRQMGIYSAMGQLYDPADSNQVMYYREDKKGQMLEEGISESGAFSAWLAAATSYSTNNCPLIPFYIYYSMFGFQRVGDLAWAAGDLQAKGFLLGGTAGRTTLNGEGLQHQDGHSHVLAATVPNCISYDPAYAFELAVIIRRGLEHMYVEQAPVYYYLTLMNEAYRHPAMPDGVEADIVKGMYLLETLGETSAPKVRLLGSGALLPEARSAAQRLVDDFGLQVQVYSVTSYTELARNVQDHQRDLLLDGDNVSVSCHVSDLLNNNDWSDAPVVAVSDYVKSLPEQVRSAIDAPFRVLGTDGFGRSDTREQLRAFFEVDRRFIQYSALSELVAVGHMQLNLRDVREQLGIDTHKPNPRQH